MNVGEFLEQHQNWLKDGKRMRVVTDKKERVIICPEIIDHGPAEFQRRVRSFEFIEEVE